MNKKHKAQNTNVKQNTKTDTEGANLGMEFGFCVFRTVFCLALCVLKVVF